MVTDLKDIIDGSLLCHPHSCILVVESNKELREIHLLGRLSLLGSQYKYRCSLRH